AWAHSSAHGPQTDRSAVVAHVALHHQLRLDVDLGHPKGTRQHAVRTCNAPRIESAADYAVFAFLDCVGRTHHRAGRLGAMHANHRHCRDGVGAIDVVHVDHGNSTVTVAFGAGGYAAPAADAAGRIDVELVTEHYTPLARGGSARISSV